MAFWSRQGRSPLSAIAGSWSAGTNSTIRTAFTITGVAFILICAIGLIIATSLGGIGSLAPENIDRAQIFTGNGDYQKLQILLIVGVIAILISSVLSIIWVFKIQTASMPFILTVFSIYVLGQGVGFGLIFLAFQIQEAAAVFGIGGGIFLAMAAVGYFFKNMQGMGKFIIAGSIVMLICSIVSIALYFSGVYSQIWVLIVTILAGILFMAYTAYDVWIMRRMAEWGQSSGEGFRDRIAWFFGFKLLTDLIALIRIVAMMARYAR